LWLDCLYRADLGIALYELGNINHESMAGAGNKLNLYLKAGIPSIVPRIADFERVAQEYGVAAVADPGDPRSIGAAVNAILGDADTYRGMAEHARVLFQREFNFETQYGPVLDWLQAAAD
jgi:glycosyltransferase involved in cell wall biosynthesis